MNQTFREIEINNSQGAARLSGNPGWERIGHLVPNNPDGSIFPKKPDGRFARTMLRSGSEMREEWALQNIIH
jgi:hypothetical protein